MNETETRLYTGMKIKFPAFKFNILAKQIESAKSIFIQPKMRTCIEITDEHIKVAQFEYINEEPCLMHLVTRKIPSSDDNDIIKALKAALSGLKIRDSILSCLNRHQVTVRYLKLPSLNPQELEAMLDFQITKQIPYPREETFYSYTPINIDPEGYTDVLLAIVHQEVIARHLKILKACNIEPELVSFNALASSLWFLNLYNQTEESMLFIDVDAVYANIGAIDYRGLSFTRTIKVGGNDFESENVSAALKQLNEEIRLSISTYERDSGMPLVKRAVLTGAVSALDKIKDSLEKEFNFTVEIKLPLENIKVSKDVLEKNWFDMHKVSLNPVLGLGLEKNTGFELNLLPPSFAEVKEKRKTKYEFYLSVIISALILLTLVSFLARKINDKSRYLNLLNRKMQEISADVQLLEEHKRDLKLIEDIVGGRNTGLYVLLELHKIVPQEIEITNFDFEDKKGVTLKGISKTMAGVFKFVGVLDKSQYFTNSKVRFVKKRAGSEDLTDFEIFSPLKTKGDKSDI